MSETDPDYCPACGEKGYYESKDEAQADIRTCDNEECRCCFYLDKEVKN